MTEAFICDAIRTPIGRYGGALASVRTDDLAALPIKALMVGCIVLMILQAISLVFKYYAAVRGRTIA